MANTVEELLDEVRDMVGIDKALVRPALYFTKKEVIHLLGFLKSLRLEGGNECKNSIRS